MKKAKATEILDGRELMTITVPFKEGANTPTITESDIDALRDKVAAMEAPACDPETAVEKLKRMIADGKIARLYAEKRENYAKIATPEAHGDVFGFIEMEFFALRQIMDEDEPDFMPEIHEEILRAALTFSTCLRIMIADCIDDAKNPRSGVGMRMLTALTHRRNDAQNAVKVAILAAASRAKRIGSDSYRLWRDALEILVANENEMDDAMDKGAVDRLIELLRAANMMLFLDASIANYVPTTTPDDDEGKETDHVL